MIENFIKTNYHTHTNFCDGKCSAEDMVKAAIEKKFDILGFSGHSMYTFADRYHISPKEHEAYSTEVRRLKEEYKDKLEIYLGFEADFVEGLCCPDMNNYSKFSPDYLIGSVHYVWGDKGYYEADDSFDNIVARIERYFDGNKKEAIQTYFATERNMLEKGNFMFIGHPDLVRKQNGKKMLFDETDSWYKKELKATAKAIAKAGVAAEINVGGIARGYMETPYPSLEFLELLHENNVPVAFASDAHTTEHLDYWMEDALEYIKKAGYKEIHYFKAGSLKSQRI